MTKISLGKGINLGLRRAMNMVNAGELDRIAETFRPFRAYAAMHLWTGLQRSEP